MSLLHFTSEYSLYFSNKNVSVIPADIWEILSEHEVHVLDFGKNALTEFPSKLVLLAGSRYI
jgi:hypothetical protein